MIKNILKKIIIISIGILILTNFSSAYPNEIEEKNNAIKLLYIIPIIGIAVSGFLWYKYGRDNVLVEPLEFYPPKGFNSLELGFMYKGKANVKDVASLFIYLANKGYIKISNNNLIEKIKDYDGDNYFEREFLNGLFKKDKNKVRLEELDDYFYVTISNILNEINSNENRNRIFYKGTFFRKFLSILMIILSIIVTISVPILEYGESAEIFFILFTVFIFLMIYVEINKEEKNKNKRAINNICFIFIMFLLMMLTSFFKAITSENIHLIGVIISILCIIGMIITFKNMPKRTKYGLEILGKIKGFKHFLETAEKEELEEKVNENPKYFYDILPFTYVLDVSSIWIDKFEDIDLDQIIIYNYDEILNSTNFDSLINNIIEHIKVKTS